MYPELLLQEDGSIRRIFLMRCDCGAGVRSERLESKVCFRGRCCCCAREADGGAGGQQEESVVQRARLLVERTAAEEAREFGRWRCSALVAA